MKRKKFRQGITEKARSGVATDSVTLALQSEIGSPNLMLDITLDFNLLCWLPEA